MKIAQVITGLPKAAGTTTFVENVTTALQELGHEVKIVTLGDLEQFLAEEPPDVVHIHALWSRMLHRVAVWTRQKDVPVVWSTHGMTAPWALHHKWWKKCLLWHLVQRRDLQLATKIHCTTELEEGWNRALGFERTFVAPLGTRGGMVEKDGRVEVKRCRGEKKRRVLLYVGRIYPVKALDNLIRAFALVPLNDWRLRLVGPDQAGHLAELKALCEQLGVAETVEFVGPKFDAELEAEYAGCDALALVSHTENFGATVVDAMAHGKPVVTSTKTPWKVVADERCGWWVDNAPEQLAKTLTELFAMTPQERDEMGAKGLALVERRYTWPAVAWALAAEYASVAT